MNKIKEMMDKISKRVYITSGVIALIIIVGLTVWPFSIINFKKESAKETNIPTEVSAEGNVEEVFTKDNVARGEYRNDVQGATIYVNSTQELQVAVIADKTAQDILGNTKEISCGNIAFVTLRVTGPAVLTNSLKALFEDKVEADFVPGNIIPLYHPELTLEKVVIESGVAKVYLGGNFSGAKDGICDASLAIAQIVETAKAFDSVTSVEIYQGDKKVY